MGCNQIVFIGDKWQIMGLLFSVFSKCESLKDSLKIHQNLFVFAHTLLLLGFTLSLWLLCVSKDKFWHHVCRLLERLIVSDTRTVAQQFLYAIYMIKVCASVINFIFTFIWFVQLQIPLVCSRYFYLTWF